MESDSNAAIGRAVYQPPHHQAAGPDGTIGFQPFRRHPAIIGRQNLSNSLARTPTVQNTDI
eukprot:IDg4416t1